jgi:hypothetical protein
MAERLQNISVSGVQILSPRFFIALFRFRLFFFRSHFGATDSGKFYQANQAAGSAPASNKKGPPDYSENPQKQNRQIK